MPARPLRSPPARVCKERPRAGRSFECHLLNVNSAATAVLIASNYSTDPTAGDPVSRGPFPQTPASMRERAAPWSRRRRCPSPRNARAFQRRWRFITSGRNLMPKTERTCPWARRAKVHRFDMTILGRLASSCLARTFERTASTSPHACLQRKPIPTIVDTHDLNTQVQAQTRVMPRQG